MTPESTGAQRSTQPSAQPAAASHDEPYTWGRPPTTYLSFRETVRLTILRSKLESVRHARLHGQPAADAADGLSRSAEPAPSDCAR